ncbi:hypothetical protein JXL19_08255 [bacterium]|nr:hypothetical protein [bacterium]
MKPLLFLNFLQPSRHLIVILSSTIIIIMTTMTAGSVFPETPGLMDAIEDEVPASELDLPPDNIIFIKGRVYNESGNGVSGALVSGWKPDGSGYCASETDPNGDYTMTVMGGEWIIVPEPGPELPYLMLGPPAVVFAASGETITGVDFVLTSAGSRITGIAVNAKTGEPLCEIEAQAWAEQIVSPDEAGFFSSAPYVECTFVMKAQADREYNIGMDVASYEPYVSGRIGPLCVPPGENIAVQVPLMLKDSLIEGQLKDALTGQPPASPVNAEIFGEDDHGRWVSAMVNPENASYTLGVVSGNWHIGLRLFPESGYITETDTIHLNIQPEQVIQRDFIIRPVDSYIGGRVLDPNGIIPVQAFILLEGETTFGGYFETSIESDQMGNFEMLVPEGRYFIRATLPPEDLSSKGWLNPPPAGDVNLSASSPVTNLELIFRELDGGISGRITFAEGIVVNPVHPAYVWGWSESGEYTENEAVILEGHAGTFEYTLPVAKNAVWHIGAVYEDWQNGFFYESQAVPVAVLPTTGLANKDLILEGPLPLSRPFVVSFDSAQMQTIILPDGMEIRIPPGALTVSADSQTVTLHIFPAKEIHPEEGKRMIGDCYDIKAFDENGDEITQFYKNAVMVFHYPPDADLAVTGISEYMLMPFYYSGSHGLWIVAEGYVVDTFHNEITVQINCFDRFALMVNELMEYTEPGADLSVLEFETPDSASPGQILSEGLSLRIENLGTEGSAEFYTGIYLSTDPVVTPDDILLTGGQRILTGIEAGSSQDAYLADWMIRIPENISEGPYYIGALVDNLGELREKGKENNDAAIPIHIGATSGEANLYVVSFNGPSSANTGEAVGSSISLKIGNNGQANPGQFSVGIYLSPDPQISPWDQLLDGGRKTLYSLLPGASVQVPFDASVSIPAGIAPGGYYIGVLIDDMEQVTETFESDNYKSNVIDIKGVDLFIESFDSLRYSAGAGQSMGDYIKVRVKNIGQGDGSHSYNVGIYLSTDAVITQSDLLLSNGMASLPPLASGASADVFFSKAIAIPSSVDPADNYYYIGALVDVYDHEAEDNENNNFKSSPFRIATDTWTVMAYLDGDCNREWQALDSLDQMEQVNQAGVPINLVALVDRHPNDPVSGYTGGYSGDKVPSNGTVWSDTRWGPVIYDGIRKSFATNMVIFDANQPELNVADGKTLSDFILKMMAVAPARHYALIIYNHGSMGGIAQDDTSNDGGIKMPELKAAFDAVPHIDIVVLDACLMQEMEVVTEMIGEVDYVMASQAERVASMINLDKSLKWLQNNYNATPAQLAERLFIEDHHDTITPASMKGCVSVIDIREVGKLNQLIDTFATTAINNATVPDWTRFRDLRGGVETFAWDSYLDLREYMQNIANDAYFPALFTSSAVDVISQINKAVVHQKGYGTGLSINLPANNTKIHPGYNGNGFTFVDTSHTHGTHWREFLAHLPSNTSTVVIKSLLDTEWGDFIIQTHNIDAGAGQPFFAESMISQTKYGPDVDFFQFTPSAGQVLYADVFGNPANGGLMPVLTVYAPDMDTVLAQAVADENGAASIRSLDLPYQEGTYYLAVTSAGNMNPLQSEGGDTEGAYSLSMIFGEPEALKPGLDVQTPALFFGEIKTGSWDVKTINLTNTGGTLLEITSFELPPDSQFLAPYTPIILPVNLGSGETFSLSIGVNPRETGAISDTLKVISTDPDRPVYDVLLEAVGIDSDFYHYPLAEGWNLISYQASVCFYDTGFPVTDLNLFIIDTNDVEFIYKESLKNWLMDDANSPIRDAADPNKAGDWQRITSFDHDGAHLLDKDLPEFVNTLHYICLGYGYWIKMNKDGYLVMQGQPATADISLNLKTGWNLMGYIPPDVCYAKDPNAQANTCPYKEGIYQQEEGIGFCPVDPFPLTPLVSISGKYQRITSFDTCDGAKLYDKDLPDFVNTLDYIGPKYGYWIKMLEDGKLVFPGGCP